MNIELKQFIKNCAKDLGFTHIGFTSPNHTYFLNDILNFWLNNNYHGSMDWIKIREKERKNIFNYYPQVKTVISLSMNYFTGNANKKSDNGKISNYAWGDDYHTLIKPRLLKLLQLIKEKQTNISGIACVDTSPIMEKFWAQKSGIGWIGKHTNLITKDFGSWVFLGEILLNVAIENDTPFKEDLCGTCTACLDACPTNAFPEPFILDSSKCISYLTIENRKEIPIKFIDKLSNWIYGCDICQEVCPWNIKFEKNSLENAYQPRYNFQNRSINEWNQLTEDIFRLEFKNSAVKRTKFSGIKRNINAVLTG